MILLGVWLAIASSSDPYTICGLPPCCAGILFLILLSAAYDQGKNDAGRRF